jgi:phage protein D
METIAATVKIVYENKDISRDLAPLLLAFTYTDKTEGEPDEIEVAVQNSDLRWLNDWQPKKGDTIEAEIHAPDGSILQCGKFTIDEPTYSGSSAGDICVLKALSAGVNDPIRSKRTVAHENKTLREIANKIAARHGYTVQGITKDFKIQYEAQYRETDLAFLHRLAQQYGYIFNVRGKTLVFTSIYSLHERSASATIERTQCNSYSIRDKITQIYSKAKHRHRHRGKKSLISALFDTGESSADTLNVYDNVDDAGQSEDVAKARVYKKNLLQVTADITGLPGNVYLVAGNNVTLSGWGNYDGSYAVKESVHTVTRDGSYKVESLQCNKLK